MTKDNDGWGSKWPEFPNKLEPITQTEVRDKLEGKWLSETFKISEETWNDLKTRTKDDWLSHNSDATPIAIGWDLAADTGDKTVLTKLQNSIINTDKSSTEIIYQTQLKSQGSNLVDSKAYLYFQCESCNAILDPHTKSFKALQEYRVNAGWACEWNIDGMGYKVYCTDCGKGK